LANRALNPGECSPIIGRTWREPNKIGLNWKNRFEKNARQQPKHIGKRTLRSINGTKSKNDGTIRLALGSPGKPRPSGKFIGRFTPSRIFSGIPEKIEFTGHRKIRGRPA
jgi:hypothetical protein